MKCISIDVGLTGAMACTDHAGRTTVADLPVKMVEGEKRLDGRALLDTLHRWVPVGDACVLVVEDIRPRPKGNGDAHGNTMHSQGSIMRSRGAIEAAADIAGFGITWVQPQRWKKHFGLTQKKVDGETPSQASARAKEASRQLALKMMPHMAGALTRKGDHNRAEALLLARWGLATQI
jgi:hypothetical protein